MRHVDVFNGDADGICALHQLRLADPVEATLVTGLKHDIALLDRVEAQPGDRVTVLDISLERNRAALLALLERGVSVRYFDHHRAGAIPTHPGFEAHIDAGGLACTSELVDRHLGGRFRDWAVVAAFGDNLEDAALRLGAGHPPEALARLKSLGRNLNYNAYGLTPEDVLVAPVELYRIVSRHASPFDLLEEPIVKRLDEEREADLARAMDVPALVRATGHAAWSLPDARWARRVLGTFAHRLAREHPGLAHVVLVPLPGAGYAVSVRVPRGCATSAAEFCGRYPGGGGRVTAAGIESLPREGLEAFLEAFAAAYP